MAGGEEAPHMLDEEKNEVATTTASDPQTAGAEGAAATAEAPKNPNMKWYIIHSYSGFERKVKESLESRVTAFGLQDKIGKVLIPTESVTEVRVSDSTELSEVLPLPTHQESVAGQPEHPRLSGNVLPRS